MNKKISLRLLQAVQGLSLVVFLAGLSGCQSSDTQPINMQLTDTQHIEGKFTPPDGKALLFMGQDSDTLSDYVEAVPEDNIEAVTLYTQLKHANPDKTLYGVYAPADWHAGTVDFGATLAESPKAALAIGLAFDQCDGGVHAENIAQGVYDSSLTKLTDYFKSIAPRKVFLRIGYEFDGAWNCYKPESYKAAYRYIAQNISAAGVTNVATVWQSATWPDATVAGDNASLYDHTMPGFLDSWYPGDDVVDWVGVSVFYRDLSQWNYTPPDTPARAQETLLTFARNHTKPVMIAEAAPQGYRVGALTHSVIQQNAQTPVTAERIWRDWYAPFFEFIYSNSDVIRAVAYINAHWETQGMWECNPGVAAGQEGCNSGNWGDSRVQANPLIKQRWLEQVNNNAHWVQHSDY
ncbi:hypothetical protein KO528_20085 [Saccharophagus degradans]|uniref:hypothetical protein n=1 Tax=Saccharophagus degradans TaxID=86304 RepID=UPI001C08C23B|nr:hypothetical protein [Saccharophagus degradans]MBU2987676.1 hypothetical protein [Saccharophagus degradans]